MSKITNQKFNMLYNAALDAIKSEMYGYPCLRLVIGVNSGSHSDMDIHIFEKSYEIFPLYLQAMYNEREKITSFTDLRTIGYHFECLMFEKTGGINTHKGLIFAMAIFFWCLLNNNEKNKLQDEIKSFAAPLLDDFTSEQHHSVGMRL